MKRKVTKTLITLVVIIAAAIALESMWTKYLLAPWTRDARLRAEVAEISAQIPGNITAVYVENNQYIKANQPMLQIDPSDYRIAVERAQSELKQAEVRLEQYREEAERRDKIPQNLITVEDRRNADLVYEAQKATVATARSTLAKAKLDLSRTIIYAPADGFVTNMHLRVGTYLNAGDRTLAFIDINSFYVMGYFQENRIGGLKEDVPVTISFLGDNRTYKGKVQSVGRGIADTNQNASSQLLPEVAQTFPWVRLAQRIPIQITFDKLPPREFLVAGRTCTVVADSEISPNTDRWGILGYLR